MAGEIRFTSFSVAEHQCGWGLARVAGKNIPHGGVRDHEARAIPIEMEAACARNLIRGKNGQQFVRIPSVVGQLDQPDVNLVRFRYSRGMERLETITHLDAIDHVAIPVQEIAVSVDWYRKTFKCEISYQDDTWALLKFANMSLALVVPHQHPPHIGLVSEDAEKHGTLKLHRDGTRSCYVSDPAGNSVEILAADSISR